MPGRTLMSEIPFARTQSQKEIHPQEVQALMVLVAVVGLLALQSGSRDL